MKLGAHFSLLLPQGGFLFLHWAGQASGRGYGSNVNFSFLPSSNFLIFALYLGAITLLLETLVLVKVFLGMDSGSSGSFWGIVGWLEEEGSRDEY